MNARPADVVEKRTEQNKSGSDEVNKSNYNKNETNTELKTAAEAEDRLGSLIATRRGKLGVCTRRMHETKALLIEGENIDDVDKSMYMFKQAVDEFNKVHIAVQELLSEEEKETDTVDWYEPRVMNFNYFI